MKWFLILLLLIPFAAAEPYDITFFLVEGEPLDNVYTFGQKVAYQGTTDTTSIFQVNDQTTSIEETESQTIDGITITVTDSSPAASITKTNGEPTTGQVAQVTITGTAAEDNIFYTEDTINDIAITAIGLTEEGFKAITFEDTIAYTALEQDTFFFAQKIITIEDITTGQGMLSDQDLVAAKLHVEDNYNLEQYPNIFAYSNKPTYIVMGKDAPTYHSMVQTSVALSLPQTGQDYTNTFDNELPTTEGVNLILIGGPCDNSITAEFVESESCGLGTEPGEAKIQLLETGERTVMLIVGYGENEMREAGQLLQDQEPLDGTTAVLETTPTEVEEEEPEEPEEEPIIEEPEEEPAPVVIELPQQEETTPEPEPIQEEIHIEEKPPWYVRLWRWFLGLF